MVSKFKLSNIKWTPIKVDYNCVFEDQMMFYLKVNTNCIDVFYTMPKYSIDNTI